MISPEALGNAYYARRLGRIRFSLTILQDNPEVVAHLFQECTPIDMRMTFVSDSMSAVVASPSFRPLQQGDLVPLYEVIVHAPVGNDLERTFEFREIQDQERLECWI